MNRDGGRVGDELPGEIDTVVVGAGQAGLIMSYHLGRAGREHVVLDRRETLGGGWQDRWDAFQLVSPSWTTGLPGFPYDGPEPDEYLHRDGVIARMAGYATAIEAPVRLGTKVDRLTADGSNAARFRLETSRGTIRARDVIVATGAFHTPKIPPTASAFAPRIYQLHAHDYRNADQLPPGGVLLVGSGQTGCQLAEELQEVGRDVTLSVGHCGRAPRRYRGKDFFWWLRRIIEQGPDLGTPLPAVDTLPDPRARFACNPHLSGHGGGHDTNLRKFAAGGIRLVGRFEGADGERARFAADLSANLQFADEFFDQRFRTLWETFAERAGFDLPHDDRELFDFEPPEVAELDLASSSISTVLWTTGYAPDYGWLDLPVIGDFGLPRQVRGVSDVPGLTFLGLLWQHNQGSANLAGVAKDAEFLAAQWER
jgi:putative flavoprotein involved in K+ transport